MTNQSITFLRTLANIVGSIDLHTALRVLDAASLINANPEDHDVTTPAGLVAFARATNSVMVELPDRKIQAIKELRTLTAVGLVEAKNAIDSIVAADYPPRY